MAKRGIDISYWQGNVDMAKVSAAGIDFVGVKLTDGVGSQNSYAHTQSVAAKDAGLLVFFYHFGHPENKSHSATDEANFFISLIRSNSIPTADIIPALDIEQAYTNNGATEVKIPSSVSLEDWVTEFAGVMAQNDFPSIMLYSNPTYLNEYLKSGHSLGSMPLWLSEYASKITLKAAGFPDVPAIWQYSGSGTIDGVSGKVDLNTCDDLTPLMLSKSA